MPAASPVASILIVAYQSGPDLGRCLEALDRQTRRDFEVILVDNASTDGAVEAIPHYDWLTLVRAPENVGFAAGNNLAARSARGRYLVALNPDAFAEPGWLDSLIAAAERHPDAASVASVQLSHEDPDRLDGMGDPYAPWGAAWRGGKGGLAVPVAESEVFGPCAAAALYRRDAFEAVGGFCERFFCYYEDVDLALRLRRAGWRSVITPWAIVRHVGSGSTSSDFVLRHATRNRVWTYLRGMPALAGLAFAPVMAGLALAGVLAGVLRGGAGARARAPLEALRDSHQERTEHFNRAQARFYEAGADIARIERVPSISLRCPRACLGDFNHHQSPCPFGYGCAGNRIVDSRGRYRRLVPGSGLRRW
ncbi:glycosyltransferase family 2 protein, partial [Thalassobaculum salexigens]|uniref:glycosyltransferase family 2 protein n=1 Tax=Thalassobaculum salexigens TaxID=455360 RepID=UPI00248D7AFC